MISSLSLLQDKQHQVFPIILEELTIKRKKVSHWAWWVFPTDLEGASEPLPKTSVLPCEKVLLLEGDTASLWRQILELLAELIRFNQSWYDVLPEIDHGRVEFFISYWKPLGTDYPWLANVLDILEQYKPSPSWFFGFSHFFDESS